MRVIYDRLDNLDAYKGLEGALDEAIEYLKGLRDGEIADGRAPFRGDRVYASVTTAPRVPTSPWEAHRAYIDVHVCLAGSETIEYLPAAEVEGWGEYAGDTRLSDSARPGVPLPMDRTRFAVFFPWDAHRPNLGSGMGRKLVVKAARLSSPDPPAGIPFEPEGGGRAEAL
jgi:YhcH/YjgK/YiaL family protein